MLRSLLTAATICALSACATAPSNTPDDVSMGPRATQLTGYFATNPLDGKAILGPPPPPDSAHGKADRALYDETRALEGTARWKTAIQDNDLWGGGAIKRFSCALGVDINATQTPAAWRMLHRMELDVRTIGTPAKDAYACVR
ncbi:hypothetical protein [Phenylobacterium sp.]|uniref:hypothetical protein n=1 Tax=Phenylobacterium sp. TaxID=1871053 RepID=UPI003BA9B4A3